MKPLPSSDKVAYVFPGQGSQRVGMGLDLYKSSAEARQTFDEADETLGFPISRLCFEGPEDKLQQTEYAQPAIMVNSIAALRAAIKSSESPVTGNPAFVAGHSLGEYTALVAARCVDFQEAIRIVFERGRLMQEAGLGKPGGMAAVMGLDLAALEAICQETKTRISNINCPGQTIISGLKEDLAKAVALAKDKGARRTVYLEVSGAFHSHLMRPALEELASVIDSVKFRDPIYPVIANTTAKPLEKASEIKRELVEQLCSCVRWQSSIEYMIDSGVSTFVEIGPGRVLSRLIRYIDQKVQTMNIGDTMNSPEVT